MVGMMTASNQWRTRPDDQRFTSLIEMHEYVARVRGASNGKVIPSQKLLARPVDGDKETLLIEGATGGKFPYAVMSHWSFGQLATMAKARADYMRFLPTPLAADCINFGIQCAREVEETGVLITKMIDEPMPQLRAITGPNYGRVWNSQITEALINRFGDGVSGDFKVPGEFGKDVKVTKENTTLYASDRDMFVFLADEKNRITVPNRRNGLSGTLARGFYMWNSEVGKTSFGIAGFLFDFVCCNRIVWGMEEMKEIRFNHTALAPDRWLNEVHPAVLAFANASEAPITKMIEASQKSRIKDVDEFLKERFSGTMTAAIKSIHMTEEERPIESLWDAATAITAYARSLPHQDARVDLERQAGKLLAKAA